MRADGRAPDALRPMGLELSPLTWAEGSCLITVGRTRVLCAASVEDGVPRFRRGSGLGWVTAEYGMLPRATRTRSPREAGRGRPAGRTMEIQRLVGRALRCVVDMKALGERTVLLDCDVLDADGGTRTAAVTGAFVALVQAVGWLRARSALAGPILTEVLAGVSVGMVEGQACLDLDFAEDTRAEADMNLVFTASGRVVEVQGTGEQGPMDPRHFHEMMVLGERGARRICAQVRSALGETLEVAVRAPRRGDGESG